MEAVADNATIAVNATSARNAGFTRDSIILAARTPIMEENDLAMERDTIADPISGLVFEIAAYPGYRMVTYELSICWGVKVLKPEHVAVLLG